MSNIQFLPASSRGNTNIGWLNGFHSFSFGSFYEPTRLPFGPLVIMNDDTVQPGKGFGSHRHQNMEIISIPLQGAVTHKDTTGSETVIAAGDVQIMSAGSGISHSEYNLGSEEVVFLQIWLQPNKKNVPPRYQQLTYGVGKPNQFQQVVSPDADDDGLWLHQSAWLHLGNFEPGSRAVYHLKRKGNGIYIFFISGMGIVEKAILKSRDALTLSGVDEAAFTFTDSSQVLIIEVPLD